MAFNQKPGGRTNRVTIQWPELPPHENAAILEEWYDRLKESIQLALDQVAAAVAKKSS